MKYFVYNYINDEELNIKLGLIHYLLHYRSSDGYSSFIPSKFIQRIFLKHKLSSIKVYDILDRKGFIDRVLKVKGFVKYHKVYLNKCKLPIRELDQPKIFKLYFTNMHFLLPNETLPFQRVLSYPIFYDDIIEGAFKAWSNIKQLESKDEEYSDYTIEQIKNLIESHNKKIENGEPTWIRDRFGGRVHHLLSFSPSFLRHLTEFGPLIEMDIKQCQPTLLAILAEQYNGPEEYYKLFYEDFDFYKFLNEDRNIGKKIFNESVFGYQKVPILDEKLPNFHIWLNKIKQEDPSLINIRFNDFRLFDKGFKQPWIKNHWKYYKSISLACTQLEVELFTKLWRRLFKEKLFFIPVHDAIYIQRENLEKIKEIFDEVIKDTFVGSKIKLTIKIKDILLEYEDDLPYEE